MEAQEKLKRAGKAALKRLHLYSKYRYLRRFQMNAKVRKKALTEYGLRFTADSNISEVIGERIYTSFRDFMPKASDTVYDVGAQHGDYSLLCAFFGADVHAFEPLKKNLTIFNKNIEKNIKLFRRNLKLNRIPGQLIYLNGEAVGDKLDVIEIPYDEEMAGIDGKSREHVGMTTIDHYTSISESHPTILKIDVEGFELQVLKGAAETLKRYHPKIIIETHSSQLEAECLKYLADFGYKVIHTGRITQNKGWMDKVTNLFLASEEKTVGV